MDISLLGNRVLLEKPKQNGEQITEAGLIVPEFSQEDMITLEVVAVGIGNKDAKGNLIPMEVKVGDKILCSRFIPNEVTIDGKVYLSIKEHDILAIVEGEGSVL